MKYLIFDTEQGAMNYSHQKATEHGRGSIGDTIQYWYGWQETIDGKWAVQCPEGTEQPELKESQCEPI